MTRTVVLARLPALVGRVLDHPRRRAVLLGSVLVCAPPAAAAPSTWNGQGGDNNWSTGLNWSGGMAPTAGSLLVFAGLTRLTPFNDLPAGTAVTGLTFAPTAGAFTLGGNGVTLAGDITDSATTQ